MWKWIVTSVVALVIVVGSVAYYLSDKIYLRFEHAVIAPSEFGKRYAPEALRADFVYLTSTVEHIHPNVAAITDASYPQLKANELASLGRSMTRVEFFRAVAVFVGRAYRDGHTEILAPQEEWDAYRQHGGKVPPFAIKIEPERIEIVSTDAVSIPSGAELVSLNGVPAAVLRSWLLDTQSMETQSGKEAYGAARFPIWVWAYGIRPPFATVYRTRGETTPRTVTANGISAGDWKTAFTSTNDRPMKLSITNDVACLSVKNFEMPWDKYSDWLRSAFLKIHNAKVRAVILDLRENNGGDTRQSDALQSYLSVKQLPALQEVRVHTTPEVKAIYRTLLPDGFRWIPMNYVIPMLRGIQAAPDNGTYSFAPEGTAPADRNSSNPLVFTGDLYVLISPYTYSSAVIAAAPYKYWKRATMIGETTSEPMTFFGDNYEFDLPNTKLQMDVSHKQFRLFGSKGPDTGLAPDISVTPRNPDALAIARRLIAQKSRAHRT